MHMLVATNLSFAAQTYATYKYYISSQFYYRNA